MNVSSGGACASVRSNPTATAFPDQLTTSSSHLAGTPTHKRSSSGAHVNLRFSFSSLGSIGSVDSFSAMLPLLADEPGKLEVTTMLRRSPSPVTMGSSPTSRRVSNTPQREVVCDTHVPGRSSMDSFSAFIDTTLHADSTDGVRCGGSRTSFMDLDDLPMDAVDLFDEFAQGIWSRACHAAFCAHSSRCKQKQTTWHVRLQSTSRTIIRPVWENPNQVTKQLLTLIRSVFVVT